MEEAAYDYLKKLDLTRLKEELEKPSLEMFRPVFGSWIAAQEEEKTWEGETTILTSEIRKSLGDPETYFRYNPPGNIPEEMADLLGIPPTVTMEILLNSWLVYIRERGLLGDDGEITPDDNIRGLLPSHIRYKSLSINFLPALISDVFKPREGEKGDRDLFLLASETREKIKAM